MTLLDDVRAACQRLAPHGWADLLAAHGLDITAADLAPELARPLPDQPRPARLREDFALEGERGVEPGSPARSLLHHALASPNVTRQADGSELTGFPTLAIGSARRRRGCRFDRMVTGEPAVPGRIGCGRATVVGMRVALLLFLDTEVARATTPEQAGAELDAYQALTDRLAAAGVLRGGEAFLPASTARTVRVVEGEVRTEPGPVVGGDLELAGLYVLDVEDEQEALAWAAQMPVAMHGAVEVRPLMPWPSPDPSAEAVAQ